MHIIGEVRSSSTLTCTKLQVQYIHPAHTQHLPPAPSPRTPL